MHGAMGRSGASRTPCCAIGRAGPFAPRLGDSPALKREVERLRRNRRAKCRSPPMRGACVMGTRWISRYSSAARTRTPSSEPNPATLWRRSTAPPSPERGSGRLEWAHAVASADNPLTARVMVNRIWHHLFGRGIVGSPDDFGVMGETAEPPGVARLPCARLHRIQLVGEAADPLDRLIEDLPDVEQAIGGIVGARSEEPPAAAHAGPPARCRGGARRDPRDQRRVGS